MQIRYFYCSNYILLIYFTLNTIEHLESAYLCKCCITNAVHFLPDNCYKSLRYYQPVFRWLFNNNIKIIIKIKTFLHLEPDLDLHQNLMFSSLAHTVSLKSIHSVFRYSVNRQTAKQTGKQTCENITPPTSLAEVTTTETTTKAATVGYTRKSQQYFYEKLYYFIC